MNIMVSKKYSRKRISKRRRNLKLRSRRMLGGRFKDEIKFEYDEKIYNIIIKKKISWWGKKSNYSLKVEDSETNNSIFKIEPVEPGIDAFIRALFDKKQINQNLNPFIDPQRCAKTYTHLTVHNSSNYIEEFIEEFINEANEQLIRKQIIEKILVIDDTTKPNLKKLKEHVVTENNREKSVKTSWIIKLNPDKLVWTENPYCYGTTHCTIIKEDFLDETKPPRYYIMQRLKIADFRTYSRKRYYNNHTYRRSHDGSSYDETNYDKNLDTIIPGQEEAVEKINSKLSSLQFFVRDGETEFCNQQYNNDYIPLVRSGLRGFLKIIMTEDAPPEFKKLKDICVELERQQRVIEEAKASAAAAAAAAAAAEAAAEKEKKRREQSEYNAKVYHNYYRSSASPSSRNEPCC